MRVLVLSGGGSKGAFQLGVLDKLMTNPACQYDAVFGTSTGALTGAVLAQASTALEQRYYLNGLIALYRNIKGNSDIIRSGTNIFSKAWNLWRHGGIYDTSPLAALVTKNVGPKLLATSTTHLEVGYTDLAAATYQTADGKHPDILTYILASTMQPIFFQLRSDLADGGVCHMTPLADAFKWIKSFPTTAETPAPIIDIIVTNPIGTPVNVPVNYRHALDVLSRTFNIIETTLFLNDIKRALKKNAAPDVGDICVRLNLYAPAQDIGDGLDFSPSNIRSMFAVGQGTSLHGLTPP